MTLYTPNFALPYPDASSAPCDFDHDWCDFTTATQVVLDGFTSITNRTVPVIPIAELSVTTGVSMATDDEIVFDTITVDTAGWTDFDADPSGITTDRAGRFVAVGWARFAQTVVNNLVELHLRYTGQIQNPDDTIFDQGLGDTSLNVSTLVAVTVPTRWSMTAFTGNGSNLFVQQAGLTVFWHADRAAP